MKTFDQRLGVGIRLGIEAQMRMAVVAEKALQPQHVAVVGAADDHRPARAGLQQADAAQDERAHDALAELRLGDEKRAQLIGRNDQRLDRPTRDRVDERRPTGKLCQLAEERTRTMGDDGCGAARRVMARDLDFAGEDDAQPAADVAHLREPLARRKCAQGAEAPDARDLRRVQGGKHLVAARVDDGRRRHGRHGPLAALIHAPSRRAGVAP